ncbi:Geraniol 8-hydroxylase [Capsicum chinense]|nr:Geraniol 8-hydroxylase [Capsicum chinense]
MGNAKADEEPARNGKPRGGKISPNPNDPSNRSKEVMGSSLGNSLWQKCKPNAHSPPLEKTKAELAQVVRQKKVIKEAELVRLPYLHCILKETLRIHPPVALLSRKVEQDFELCGYFVPKGSEVIVNILSIGWDPAF